MRLELAERLICPAVHEATPLIVVALETSGRNLLRAQLGCMLCRRQGEVHEGSVLLGPIGKTPHAASQQEAHSEAARRDSTDEDVLRLAALLGLSEPHTLVLLSARYAALAPLLAERHEAIIAVYGASGASPENVGHLQVAEERVPFSSGTFSAAALDVSMSAATVADAVRCVRVGGRIVAEPALAVPRGVLELARDATGWVGEVEATASPVVPLRRA